MTWKPKNKNTTLEAIVYPVLLLIILWLIFIVDKSLHLDLYKYGVKPSTVEGIKGIIFMPLIHGQKDYSHILNNSIPIVVLLGILIYFYKEIALKVFILIWLLSGLLLWYLAQNTHSYHIGISGIIYGLFGFLLFSGFVRKYKPLQAISLIVAFVYGSMIWGIFPTEERISWEGHLSGLLIGLILAVAFRKHGPVSEKYAYELEPEEDENPFTFSNFQKTTSDNSTTITYTYIKNKEKVAQNKSVK